MIGTGSLAHNRRDFIAENVDPDRVHLNICYQNENLKEVYHGVQTPISILQKDVLFEGLGKEIPVGRYHSWVVSREGFPDCLEITAESQEGQIMAIRHKTYNVHGIQFHPESVLTPQGKEIIKNFLND